MDSNASYIDIDWRTGNGTFPITSSVSYDMNSYSGLDRRAKIVELARLFEECSDESHFVYCFKYEKNGEQWWYVGETGHLTNRILTHTNEKDVIGIEILESVEDVDAGRERERELSYQVAIDKETTNIGGGR